MSVEKVVVKNLSEIFVLKLDIMANNVQSKFFLIIEQLPKGNCSFYLKYCERKIILS